MASTAPDTAPVTADRSGSAARKSDTAARGDLSPGEIALMRAVLRDGILCYLGRAKRRRIDPRILAREAEHWIRIHDWDSPFSFNNVCEALGLSHHSTRNALLARKQWLTERNGPSRPTPSTREDTE